MLQRMMAFSLARLRVFLRAELLRLTPFLILILLAAGLSYRYHSLLKEQRTRVDHTYQVVTRLEAGLIALLDAETGQRGYVITGDPRYLEPYTRAETAVPTALTALRDLVSDSQGQQAKVDTISALARTKLSELSESIEARRISGSEAARKIVLRDSGRATMDQVRAVIKSMEQTELALLEQRSGDLRATEQRLLVTTVFCASLSLVARLGLHFLAWRRQKAGRPR